jgi:hypothetical protein
MMWAHAANAAQLESDTRVPDFTFAWAYMPSESEACCSKRVFDVPVPCFDFCSLRWRDAVN